MLMQSDVSLLRKAAPSSCCVNFYGATETPQAMGYFIVPEQENSSHEKRVPLGRGISDVQLLVLDESQQLAGIGQVGEIYVRTPHLARGYMDHTLTAQKFIINPFTKNVDDRLYKTGDRGRYLADGNVEFLGRTDYQVKIRGFRVELSEVEMMLTQHPNVQLAIVVASEDRNSLVAYYASETDAAPAVDELRTYLKQRLPEYLVPSKFVLMQQWPLTPQGKIDRRALPEPEQEGTNSEAVGPRTPVEEILAGIWSEVLRADHISINDDFFARGGHSLLVAQMVSRVRQALQVELPLRSVFESPTIAALADVIESLRHTSMGLELPAIERVSHEAGLPLSYAQQRLWFLDQLEPGNHFYNIAAAVRLEGLLKVDALEASLNEVLKRHEVLRSCFRTVAGEPVQVVLPLEQLMLPVIDLAGFEESDRMVEARRLANIEARQPFDLSSGPLLRAGLDTAGRRRSHPAPDYAPRCERRLVRRRVGARSDGAVRSILERETESAA